MELLAKIGAVICLFVQILLAQPPGNVQSAPKRNSGQYLSSEAQLLRALNDDPQNGSLWLSLGVARAQLDKTDLAIAAFEKALSLSSEKSPVYFGLGLLYLKKNDFAQAENAYHQGLLLDPSDPSANQNYAFLLIRRAEFRLAVAPLELLKNVSPNDVTTRATLIEAYLKTGLKNKADSEIDELLKARLATLRDGLALAKLLRDDDEKDASRKVLEHLKISWSSSPDVHGELGLLLAEKEQFRDAAGELGQAVQLSPDSIKYSLAFGNALIRSEQYPAALQFLQGAEKRFANQPDFQYQLALTDMCLQRLTEAVSKLENLKHAWPDSAKVQFLLGGAYELQGEMERSEESYRSAIRLDPQDPAHYRVLGSMLQKQGPARVEESIQLLGKALALDPNDVDSRIVLARCLEKQGDLGEAAVQLEQAVGINPGSRRAHAALAQLYRRQDKLARAEQEQTIAEKLEDQQIKKWTIWGP